jgi:hypothetical protein
LTVCRRSLWQTPVEHSVVFDVFQGIVYHLVDVLSDDIRQSEILVSSNNEEITRWLAQTFSSKQVRPTTTTNRFESIKTIIQASSFVNALQRKLRQRYQQSLTTLFHLPVDIHQLNLWSFPIMDYQQPINFTLLLIFDAHDLLSHYRIDLDLLNNFTRVLTVGYRSRTNTSIFIDENKHNQ